MAVKVAHDKRRPEKGRSLVTVTRAVRRSKLVFSCDMQCCAGKPYEVERVLATAQAVMCQPMGTPSTFGSGVGAQTRHRNSNRESLSFCIFSPRRKHSFPQEMTTRAGRSARSVFLTKIQATPSGPGAGPVCLTHRACTGQDLFFCLLSLVLKVSSQVK